MTSAMATGVTGWLWEISDLVAAWAASARREERAALVRTSVSKAHPRPARQCYDYENVDFAANRASVDFLFTDCDLAMTFLDVAGTTAIPETAQRNRQNARKAYNAILRAIPKLVLSAAERQSIENKLSALRTRLETAGEQF